MKRAKQKPHGGTDVIYIRRGLGFYFRELRQRLGFSLAELERRSGVSDSELLRIEVGAQECGLESFIRICSAMGVPWGEVLDNVVSAEQLIYRNGVVSSPVFQKLAAKYQAQANALSFSITQMAAFAAHLARCSRPAERADATHYPTGAIRTAFCSFADRLDKTFSGRDRLSLLTVERISLQEALVADPVAELQHRGLFNEDLIKGLAEMIVAIGNKGKPAHMGGGHPGEDGQPPHWTPFPSASGSASVGVPD
jgi:transcriptional regulator with XRE-family HTH domain